MNLSFGKPAYAGCSMLVGAKRKSRFIGDTGYKNDLDPYFIQHPACRVVAMKERRLEIRIQYLFVYCPMVISKNLTCLLSF